MGSEVSTQSNIRQQPTSPKNRHSISSNLPSIKFHNVHGENIRLSADGKEAKRVQSFSNGIIFSNRPIQLNERICIKFAELSLSWSGAIRFGFTSNNPNTYRNGLPKYACPDLTNKPGNWAKALGERFWALIHPDSTLFYYVNNQGEVHFGIDGEEKGVFFVGVDTKSPLWALIDVYGNTVAINLVDPRQQLNNFRQSSIQVDSIVPTFNTIDINRENREPLPQVYRHANFQSLPFHKTKGCNIKLSNDRCVAERNNSHYSQGYVFSQRHLQLGEKLVLQILQTDELFAGSLAFGLTTCDPSRLNSINLPEDPHQLLDRPEYWVVIKDVANAPQAGDELAFKINQTGEVQMIKNRQLPITLMHVDQTQKLWPFFDLYGSTIKVKVLGVTCDEITSSISSNHRNSNLSKSNGQFMNSNLKVKLPPSELKINNTESNFVSIKNNSNGSLNGFGNECTVCCEQPINCVLYMCGHVCMCYECAIKQWKGPGQCPICRAQIRDVIRTYCS